MTNKLREKGLSSNRYPTEELIGKTIGGFLIIEEIGRQSLGWQHSSRSFECMCSCGEARIKTLQDLRVRENHGRTKCTCDRYNRSTSKEAHLTDEIRRIKNLCNNKNTEFYNVFGGRGITFKEAWKDTIKAKEEIIEAIGLPPSTKHVIDRHDYNKGFYEDNIFWL